MISQFKKFLLDLIFPKFCLFCNKEGTLLCEDCFSLLEIFSFHEKFKDDYLNDLYFALNYNNYFTKKLIQKFKYPPFLKELKKEILKILISHFNLINKKPDFKEFSIIAVPLTKKKLKSRGYNQAEEIAKELAKFFNLPLITDCLIKIKETKNQVDLPEKERKENLKGAFSLKNKERIWGKKIILVDDVFTTGSTLRECAKILKKNGAKEIIGIVLAKAKPGEDKPNSI